MKKLKVFKTYEEQAEILKSKGLVLDINAIDILKRNNYYFLINRYKDIFIIPNSKPTIFKKGTKLSEIVSLYHFDRDLRSLILKYIIIIENTIKSILSHEFSKKYSYDYLNKDNFIQSPDIKKQKALKSLITSINDTIKKGIKTKKYIKYYYKNYSNIPLWVIINDLSLSLTIKFYSLLTNDDQKCIAYYFNISSEKLYNYLQFLKFYRNLAAHNQRIFDEKNEFSISKTEYHKQLNLPEAIGKNDLFALIIIFKILLVDYDFKNFTKDFKNLLHEFKNNVLIIDMKTLLEQMGLNEKWEEI